MPKIPNSLTEPLPNAQFLNRVILGNCLGVLGEIESNSIDLIVTSPPYDGLRDYHGYVFNFHGIAAELYRVTKKGGVVVWVVGDQTIKGSETGTSFRQALFFKELGFNLHDTMIYQKSNPVPLTHNRYEQEFEYMFVFSKGTPNTFLPLMVECKHAGKQSQKRTFYQTSSQDIPTLGHSNQATKSHKQAGNVWVIANIMEMEGHPAAFPEQLAFDHIRTWSNPGDVILDPMTGSGTTLVAAKKLKRKYIGIEISSEYAKIAESRVGGGILVSQYHKRKGN